MPLFLQTNDELEALAQRSVELSHELRSFRDEYGFIGTLEPDDFDYLSQFGLELACYAAMLNKSPAEQAIWLRQVIGQAQANLDRCRDYVSRSE